MKGLSEYDEARIQERRNRVAELSQQKLTVAQIARLCESNMRTIQRDRQLLGLSNPAPKPFSEHEIRLMRQMLDDGASYGEVARTIGRPHSRAHIARRLPGYCLTKQESAERSILVRQLKRLAA